MKRLLKILGVAAVVVIVAWFPVRALLLHTLGVSELTVFRSLLLQRLGLAEGPAETAPEVAAAEPPAPVELNADVAPFREIGQRLGEAAVGNNLLPTRGATVFDANGDGWPDLYLPHDQRPIAVATSEKGVLQFGQKMAPKPSVLYLGAGPGEDGLPRFESVQDRVRRGNDLFVREELLIENKYRPRTSLEDDPAAPGRVAWGAVAADFDGDSRLDLYVFGGHHGLLIQTHQLGMRVYPTRGELGRGEKREPVVVRQPSFLWGERSDGMEVTLELGDEPEAEGRNTLFLNQGDEDGDGLPEWRDATDEAGVGGRYATTSVAVADFDRDGDLDLYVANLLDPDFWGFGDRAFAGQRNQLYLNQLAETGELRFRDAALEQGVAGLHQEENLASTMWVPGEDRFVDIGEQIVEGRQVGERADHSWATAVTDWNDDGWPDLVVANDIGNRLRIYENLEGEGFRQLRDFEEPTWDGCWMGMSTGDLDGDLSEEIFITNCGSQVMSVRNTALLVADGSETNVQALSMLNYPLGRSRLHHEILSRGAGGGLEARGVETRVEHSRLLPPDMSREINFARDHAELFERNRFADGLAGLEFAFNAPMLDVENDGDLDLYMAGALLRGNDDFVGDWSGSPGRLLVNESRDGELHFRDLTLEYRLLDITDMDYESNPPRRPAPGTGWHKRDYVYATDTDSYSGAGLEAAESVTHDLLRLHESANAVLAADLDADGFQDLVVTHSGGYNSVSPAARNLGVEIAGRKLSVPAPNKVMKPPTAFEGGATFVYINGGAQRDHGDGAGGGDRAGWVKLRLLDPESHNRFGVGARVVVNDSILRHMRATQGAAFGGVHEDLHVGLGGESLRQLEIRWPSGDATPQRLSFEDPVRDRLVCVERRSGVVPCDGR